MRQLTSIVARSSTSGAIGVQNRLPWKIKTDLKFFRETTLNRVVIMGRKTHASLGGCLPRRTNIVVSHGFSPFASSDECRCVGSPEEALHAAYISGDNRTGSFVVGGAMMYAQFAPLVDRYLVTEVDKNIEDADTFFDERDFIDAKEWRKTLLKEGRANGDGDECDFKIFEYTSLNSEKIADRRKNIIRRLSNSGKRLSDMGYGPHQIVWA
ncbi:hypothetical protein DMC47_28390 [Nostoc sp. 3335mG]|nr:hypothetical protein DMC47_28390 [Nostoc sp. 3335mG]